MIGGGVVLCARCGHLEGDHAPFDGGCGIGLGFGAAGREPCPCQRFVRPLPTPPAPGACVRPRCGHAPEAHDQLGCHVDRQLYGYCTCAGYVGPDVSPRAGGNHLLVDHYQIAPGVATIEYTETGTTGAVRIVGAELTGYVTTDDDYGLGGPVNPRGRVTVHLRAEQVPAFAELLLRSWLEADAKIPTRDTAAGQSQRALVARLAELLGDTATALALEYGRGDAA